MPPHLPATPVSPRTRQRGLQIIPKAWSTCISQSSAGSMCKHKLVDENSNAGSMDCRCQSGQIITSNRVERAAIPDRSWPGSHGSLSPDHMYGDASGIPWAAIVNINHIWLQLSVQHIDKYPYGRIQSWSSVCKSATSIKRLSLMMNPSLPPA